MKNFLDFLLIFLSEGFYEALVKCYFLKNPGVNFIFFNFKPYP